MRFLGRLYLLIVVLSTSLLVNSAEGQPQRRQAPSPSSQSGATALPPAVPVLNPPGVVADASSDAEACKPGSKLDCRNACKETIVLCEGERFPDSGKAVPTMCPNWCVGRIDSEDGLCFLYIPKSSPHFPIPLKLGNPFRCFQSLTQSEVQNTIDNLKGRIIREIERVIARPGLISSSEAESLISKIHDMCAAYDENSHIQNNKACCDNKSCDEAGSTKAQADCFSEMASYAIRLGRKAGIDGTAILMGYCLKNERLELFANVEKCICQASRNGGLTPESCAECGEKTCQNPIGVLGDSHPCSPILEGVSSEIEEELKRLCLDELKGNEHSHSCDKYLECPVGVKKWSISPAKRDIITEETQCPLPPNQPPPVLTCVPGPGGGAENICLTAPPLR